VQVVRLHVCGVVSVNRSPILPERQVHEREIGLGPERSVQGAQASQCEGHCLQLDEACSNADEIIAHTQELLDESPSRPERIEFLQAVREIRSQLAQALLAARRTKQLSTPRGEDQRHEESLFIRKATLAIRLQVSRLAGILEALLSESLIGESGRSKAPNVHRSFPRTVRSQLRLLFDH